MAWIRTLSEAEADEELGKVYTELREKRGAISNIMRIHSLLPRAMKEHLDLYLALMFGPSPLTRDRRELIGVVVSATNECDYCVTHHADALDHYWRNRRRVERLCRDWRSVDLPERDRSILEYVEKLSLNPPSVDASDIQGLRDVGFTDMEILSINLIASYFNFVNRIALGLGVVSGSEEVKGYTY